MQPANYEAALLALASYRLAKSDNVDESIAIACVIRNHVIRTGIVGLTYTQVIQDFYKLRPTREWPSIANMTLTHPANGILSQIDGVYGNKTPDVTANAQNVRGAMYFARVVDEDKDGWFTEEILKRQDIHPLVGTFGAQQFYV